MHDLKDSEYTRLDRRRELVMQRPDRLRRRDVFDFGNLVDDGHGGNCADEEDDAGDACGKKSLGTSGKTDRLEDVGIVVDDSVDTDQC